MRTVFRFVLLAGLVSALWLASERPAAYGQSPDKPKAGEKPVVVPFELLPSRHMAVEVKVNGKGPYRLIFDTGAPTNLMNNKIAKASGVIGAKTAKPAFGLMGMAGQQEVKTLEIGGVKLEKATVIVMDHPTVQAISDVFGPIDGIIGFPFFARYKMTVDYQKKELTLVPNGFKPTDVMEALTSKIMGASAASKDPAVLSPAAVWGFTLADKDADDEDAGMTVKTVIEGTAASAGGLKAGDRVLTIDGRWTDTLSDTFLAASLVKPGREVAVVVKRGGKDVKLTVKPAKGV
ncbi:MAG TPA: PDZ domain-containing protein [Gemmataceae bacterium]|nr:PDZ domain-containing protein [Gemmataceae bacterium]